MKILVVGEGHSTIHEVAVVAALQRMGHSTWSFYWHNYFFSGNPLVRMWRRAQNKFLTGPTIIRLNNDLISHAVKLQPELIFIYRGTHIFPITLIKIKSSIPSCQVFGYNNDDPFAEGHPPWQWRYFISCVPIYDLVFAYRSHNLDNLLNIGAKQVALLRSWFLPEIHKPITHTNKYETDCIFVGHYEPDGRAECIKALIENNIKVKLYGPYSGLKKSGWKYPISQSKILKRLLPVSYLKGQQYVEAISSSPIALCFLSKLNRDSYTRRCFEIPAIGAALFSEYSADLASLFVDGKEAVFFRDKHELVNKVKYYLANPEELRDIQLRGRKRVINDGHDIYSRLDQVVKRAERQ